jgi:5-methylcytosine-specific restriction protein A
MEQRWGTNRTATTSWRRTRVRILKRDGYRCQIAYDRCEGLANSVDHIVPVHRGGTDDDSNLQAAGGRCHRTKTGREARAARPTEKRPPEKHPGFLS